MALPSLRIAVILGGGMDQKTFSCVGKTVKGERCGNPIAKPNRQSAYRYLTQLDRLSLEDITDAQLKTLSQYVLCISWHNEGRLGQQDDMVQLWKQRIQLEIQQPDSSEDESSSPSSTQRRAPQRTSRSAAWNPAEVLTGTMDASCFTCVGVAKTGHRCTQPIATHNIYHVHDILDELGRCDYRENLDDVLYRLASLALCRRWHIKPGYSQVHRMVGIWKAEIEAFKTRQSHAQSDSITSRASPGRQRQISRTSTQDPAGYLPTPPHSRSGTPVPPSPVTSATSQSPRTQVSPLVLGETTVRNPGVDFALASPPLSPTVRQQASTENPDTAAGVPSPLAVTTDALESEVSEGEREDNIAQRVDAELDIQSLVADQVSSVHEDQAEESIAPTAPLGPCPNSEFHLSRRHRLPADCAVCCEPMEVTERLAWCKAQCGQNFHEECIRHWLEVSTEPVPWCPYCRTAWDLERCVCDDEPPVVELPEPEAPSVETSPDEVTGIDGVLGIWMDLPDAAQANLLWGPFPPHAR